MRSLSKTRSFALVHDELPSLHTSMNISFRKFALFRMEQLLLVGSQSRVRVDIFMPELESESLEIRRVSSPGIVPQQ